MSDYESVDEKSLIRLCLEKRQKRIQAVKCYTIMLIGIFEGLNFY